MKKLILFLVRRKLGVKRLQAFRFANQKAPMNWYIFDNDGVLWKVEYWSNNTKQILKRSKVSLNWLMDEACKIKICEDQAYCLTIFNTLVMRQVLTTQESMQELFE